MLLPLNILKRDRLSKKAKLAVFIALGLIWPSTSLAQYGNLAVFPQVGVSQGYNQGEVPDKDELPEVELDLLHTYQHSWFRSIIEYRLDTDGDTRLERFQLGAKLPHNTYLWLGKFHSINDYWLENYHEGAYLSPSVTTPFSSSLGYEGGLTSSHLSGIKIEHFRPLGEGQLAFKASVGLTQPITDLDTSPSLSEFYTDFDRDNLTCAGKVSYMPKVDEETEVGLTYARGNAGYNEDELTEALGPFFASLIASTNLDISMLNVYANLQKDRWRVLASWNRMDSSVTETTGSAVSSFFGPGGDRDATSDFSYLFASYDLTDKLNIYARYDKLRTDSVGRSVAPIFTGLNFDLNYSRSIIGVKYDFAKRQAITLEATDQESLGQPQSAVHLTWSAAFDWNL